ncbi:MAG TPA: DNA translocase FtsK 4TM domain-containing protein, partial [Paracoccaceae bacterium]|nr:DNA translocase FtsK 4TM domain-containing protein [Paracoccaceae bacterium]
MAFFSSDGARTPLFDDRMSAAIRRRVAELWGLGLGLLAAGLAAALWSYDVGDPSPFSATTQPPVNWMGGPGAIVADTAIRYLGLGAWALVAFFAAWSVRFLGHVGEERIWARMVAAPPLLMLAPVFASTHAVYGSWPLSGTGLGGMLGDAGARALLHLVPFDPVTGLQLLSLGLGAGVLGLGAVALGFTLPELGAIGRWLGRSLAVVAGAAGRRAAGAGRQGLVRGRDWLHEHRRRRSEVLAPAEPTGTWRTRMAEMSLRLPGVGVAAGSGREEPEFGPGRIMDDDAHAPRIVPRVDADHVDEDDVNGVAPGRAPRPLRAIFDRLSGVERTLDPEPAAPVADPPRPPVARDPVPAKKSRRAQAERQPKLALEDAAEAEAYAPPPLALLQKPVSVVRHPTSDAALEENARMLETVLEDYGVRGEIMAVRPGPVVTLYELEPAPGLKASRVIGLADDIARSMSALAARVSTVPGRSIIGIELPNAQREKVWLRDLFETTEYGDARYPLALALGKDISGSPIVVNLAKMPHLLIAGTTGSGKSVAINTMILSLLYRLGPDKCRVIMIDPKMLELSVYDNIPHLLAPVVTDPKKAIVALKWVVAEMEERYRKMSK